MSRQIQFRRGTADQHKTFTGAPGEITVDLTNKTLRVHDGETPGGTMLARMSDVGFVPSYSNAIVIPAFPYTVPQDGWIYLRIFCLETYATVTINGAEVFLCGGTERNKDSAFMPVSVGDTINLTGGTEIEKKFFFPCHN